MLLSEIASVAKIEHEEDEEIDAVAIEDTSGETTGEVTDTEAGENEADAAEGEEGEPKE